METNLRTLGPHETKVILSLREQGREVVHVADIIGLLGSEPTARKVIRNLIRKGWLTRLVGGRYMLLPPSTGLRTLAKITRLPSPPPPPSRPMSGGGPPPRFMVSPRKSP